MSDFDYSSGNCAPAPAAPRFPPSSWPSKDQLDYARLAMTVFLLGLGTAWIALMLVKSPGKVFAGAGRQHLGGRI